MANSGSPVDKHLTLMSRSGHCVKPRLVHERSFVNSVTELVCNAMPCPSSPPNCATEKIEWVSVIDECDLTDHTTKSYLEKIVGPHLPVLLVVGYSRGFQIWALLSNGECEELLSIRDVSVHCVKFLPEPKHDLSLEDKYSSSRPLLAICDGSGSAKRFTSMSIVSLTQKKTGAVDPIRRFNFEEHVVNVLTNSRAVVVMFAAKIVILDPLSFTEQFWIKNCFNDMNINSLSLSSNWIAYSDTTINPILQSCGGVSSCDDSSYASQVVTVAKNLGKTVTELGASLATSFTSVSSNHRTPMGHHHRTHLPKLAQKSDSFESMIAFGVVTVLDLERFHRKEYAQCDIHNTTDGQGVVAHFLANAEEPVACVQFNANGSMLLTAGTSGQHFDVFLLLPHPGAPSLGAVQHLYSLQRGTTVARIQSVSFALDSRWVAVSTVNGTTHIFPITPYGGPVNVRTHTSRRMLNRESRFHRSAGLESLDGHTAISMGAVCQSLPTVPYPTAANCSPSLAALRNRDQHPVAALRRSASLGGRTVNPRLPPYVPPTVLPAAAKIRHSLMSADGAAGSTTSRQLVTTFAAPRGIGRRPDTYVDSLFTLRSNGQLLEYQLTVKPFTIGARVCDETPIELHVVPGLEWLLCRSKTEPETNLPLPPDHILVEATKFKQRIGTQTAQTKKTSKGLWISQVEIVTYSGPHRRLWMGPQFTFKTYLDSQKSASLVCPSQYGRSEPLSIGGGKASSAVLHSIPVVIEASSTGSLDRAALGMAAAEVCGSWSESGDYLWPAAAAMAGDESASVANSQHHLRQCIAEAMVDRAMSPTAGHTDLADEMSNSTDSRSRCSSSRDNCCQPDL